MNQLRVGTQKTFDDPSGPFLIIDKGAFIDDFLSRSKRKATVLDFIDDSFNPLSKPTYEKSLNFVSIRNEIFPAAQETLRKQDSNHLLLDALREKPKDFPKLLDKLTPHGPKDTARLDVYQNLEELLWSPVLKKVFCEEQNFTLRGILLARLGTAMARRDRFTIAQFLIEQYQAQTQGHIWITDFGFYGRPHHLSLIDQNRLIAGVNFLDEVPEELKNPLLLIDDKKGQHCTAQDAETLANYSGYPAHSEGWTGEVQKAIL